VRGQIIIFVVLCVPIISKLRPNIKFVAGKVLHHLIKYILLIVGITNFWPDIVIKIQSLLFRLNVFEHSVNSTNVQQKTHKMCGTFIFFIF
jgi:hypothetical protein